MSADSQSTALSRSLASLPSDYRARLEASNLPIEIAVAIADAVDVALRSEKAPHFVNTGDTHVVCQCDKCKAPAPNAAETARPSIEPSGETPLTDALITDPMTERESVLFLHARTLERELAALRSQPSATVPLEVYMGLMVLLNHIEPGFENCRAVVKNWYDGLPRPDVAVDGGAKDG